MSSIDARWSETSFTTSKWHTLKDWQDSWKHINPFFAKKKKPMEICSHLTEKASKGRFPQPDKLQNYTNEGKAKERKRQRGGRKEEKRKKQWLHS